MLRPLPSKSVHGNKRLAQTNLSHKNGKRIVLEEVRTSDSSHAIVREQGNTLIFLGSHFADCEKPYP